MHLSWRDWLATAFVAAAAVIYILWLTGTELFGTSGPRVVTGMVFGFGLAASLTAVVFGVGEGLFRTNKVYLVIASVLGLAAFITGVIAFTDENEAMLAALVVATVALWLMSTLRHGLSAGPPSAITG
jgi:hypothetical protein